MAIELLVDENGAVLSVDAVLVERHEMASRVSQYPVEDGGTISDHILNEPRRVSIEGFVTDSPLSGLPVPGAGIIEAVALAGQSPTRGAFGFLESLRDDRMRVTLVTGLKRYESMVLTTLSIPRDGGTGQALRFSADFVEIEVVETQSVTIPADQLQPGKAMQQGASELDMGKQQPEIVSDAERKSMAKLIQEGMTDLFEGLEGFDDMLTVGP